MSALSLTDGTAPAGETRPVSAGHVTARRVGSRASAAPLAERHRRVLVAAMHLRREAAAARRRTQRERDARYVSTDAEGTGWVTQCAWCRRVRTVAGSWRAIPARFGPAEWTHGICPPCTAAFETTAPAGSSPRLTS